jgi:hypothetical protein
MTKQKADNLVILIAIGRQSCTTTPSSRCWIRTSRRTVYPILLLFNGLALLIQRISFETEKESNVKENLG